MLSRKFTDEEMDRVRTYIDDKFRNSISNDMFAVCYFTIDVFNLYDEYSAFFTDRHRAEDFIDALHTDFENHNIRYIIYDNLGFFRNNCLDNIDAE